LAKKRRTTTQRNKGKGGGGDLGPVRCWMVARADPYRENWRGKKRNQKSRKNLRQSKWGAKPILKTGVSLKKANGARS